MRLRGPCSIAIVLSACGGSAQPQAPTGPVASSRGDAASRPRAPLSSPAAAARAPGDPASRRQALTEVEVRAPELPAGCEGASTKYCFPPLAFVKALCAGRYPGVALHMFRKSEPWQHAFVKVRHVMPVNYYRGPRSHAPLTFSEEVVLLRHRPYVPHDGINVHAPDNFDVLRLSGTCAVLAEDELRTRWAGPSSYAPLLWTRLDAAFRDALGQSARIDRARRAQTDGCGGSSIGGGGAVCQRATDDLVRAIMLEIDSGLSLPRPEALPPWSPRDGGDSPN